MEKGFKGFTEKLYIPMPYRWNGYITLGLVMNTIDRTLFRNTNITFPSRAPASRLNTDVSIVLSDEIHHSASNESGILKLRELNYESAKHMIYVKTRYAFYVDSKDLCPESVLSLCDRYLRELGKMVNTFFVENEFGFPYGPADFYEYCMIPKHGPVTPETIDSRISFWLPVEKGQQERRVRWYTPKVTDGVYLEGAEGELQGIFAEYSIWKSVRPDFYIGGETS